MMSIYRETHIFVYQKTNNGTIEVQYIAENALQVEWQDIKKANHKVEDRIKGTPGSLENAILRLLYERKWHAKVKRCGSDGTRFELDLKKLQKSLPFPSMRTRS